MANSRNSVSAFSDTGLRDGVADLVEEIRDLYREDGVPWVVGYSGGKDSTAVLQLIWLALDGLEPEQRHKKVHVISTDTLVENPVVAAWVNQSLVQMCAAASTQAIPIEPHRLTPDVANTFWVNLIGRGYPAPRHKFRWCTERLKINPSNSFINGVSQEFGQVIVVLGTRKAESAIRARSMTRQERHRVRDRLSPNASLLNSLVYTPVESWTNDDVWMFLMQFDNPWGYDNKDLLTMYQGASPDGECPLVVDSTTPSCGDSRFGCWVCTLVEKDKSMQAMIQNDEEKEWMLPLLELRNALDLKDDRHLRDYRRMSGAVQLFHDRPIPGPYTQEARADWLRRLLEAQRWIRNNGPSYVRAIDLITLDELQEIRRIWVVDKHEFEDLVPQVYEAATGERYPGRTIDEDPVFGKEEAALLLEAADGNRAHYELARELLDVERRYASSARRAGVYTSLEKAFRRGFYENEEDAVDRARRYRDAQPELPLTPDPENL